ncbi:3077_t:CDS:2, partial [Gigaspora rosea]
SNGFDVDTTYDDINLNVLDKTITQYYFLLYDGNMQITGIVLDYNKRI